VVAPLLVASSVAAQHASPQAWFDSVWQETRQVPDLRTVRFVIELSEEYVPEPDALRDMRAAVAGRPEHLDRFQLATYERRIAEGPDKYRLDLWVGGPRTWRYSKTPLHSGEEINVDVGVDGSSAWTLADDRALNVIDATTQPPSGHDIMSVATDVRHHINAIVFGRLDILNALEPRAEPIELQKGDEEKKSAFRLTIRAGKGNQVAIADCNWIQSDEVESAGGVGHIRRLAVRGTGFASGKPITMDFVFSDWRYEPALQRWIAWRAEERRDGGAQRSWKVLEVVSVSEEDITALTSVPRSGRIDPVRGAVELTSVSDFRAGVRSDVVTDVDSGEAKTVVSTIPTQETSRGSTRSPLGWIVLAAAVSATFVVLWIRRRKLA
jgi:hypothetical protein